MSAARFATLDSALAAARARRETSRVVVFVVRFARERTARVLTLAEVVAEQRSRAAQQRSTSYDVLATV